MQPDAINGNMKEASNSCGTDVLGTYEPEEERPQLR